jgi:hypothetical protein
VAGILILFGWFFASDSLDAAIAELVPQGLKPTSFLCCIGTNKEVAENRSLFGAPLRCALAFGREEKRILLLFTQGSAPTLRLRRSTLG